MWKKTIGMRIGQGPMFSPALHVITALDVVKAALIAPIGAGVKPPFAVEFHTKRISASFGEQFKLARRWMIAPDGLAEKTNAFDGGGAGAALRSVEPAIGSPRQAVGHRMGIFQAEAREVHFRLNVRNVVAVPIGIKQKVRWIEHPDPAAPWQRAGGNVQSGHEILVRFINAIPILVFEDR